MDAIQSVLTSQILAGLEFNKPEHNAMLFRPLGDQGASWFITQQLLGFEKEVSAEEYYSWEEGRIHETFLVRANVAAPGAGNDIVVVVAAASMDASNRFYVQRGDDVKFANQVSGYVRVVDKTTDPTAPSITIAPYNVASDIGALTAGDEIVIYSNNASEGSDQPGSRITKPTKRTGHLTMVKSTFSTTGHERTNMTWTNIVDGVSGQFLGRYSIELDINLGFRHNLAMSHKLLVSELTTNTTKVVDSTAIANADPVAYGTEGLITAMAARAIQSAKASGAVVLDDFYVWNLALTKQHNSSDVLAMCGNKRMQNVIKILFAANYNTGVDWTEKTMASGLVGDVGDTRARAMALDVRTLDIDGRRWHFKNMNEFNNPETLGAENMPYRDMMAVVPIGRTTDAKSREVIPYSGMRFKKLGDYNRKMEVWEDGTAGPGAKNGQSDVKHHYMRSHIGAEHVCVNKYLLVQAP
jgi:hypothetical protein